MKRLRVRAAHRRDDRPRLQRQVRLMMTTPSADGTTIAFERSGAGEPLIVVGGAMCDRARTRPTSAAFATELSVINYDRRGRGDSGDRAPYAVEREIDDL